MLFFNGKFVFPNACQAHIAPFPLSIAVCLSDCFVWPVIFNYATDNLRGQRLTEESMMLTKMKTKLKMCVCVYMRVCACAAVD